MIVTLFCLPFWLFKYKEDSLKYSFDRKNREEGTRLIARIYKDSDEQGIALTHDQIYDELNDAYLLANKNVVHISFG